MEEQLISFKTAKIAKEKGFYSDKIGFTKQYYNNDGSHIYEGNDENFKIPAPTQSLLQKWLREIHSINICISFKPNIKKWDFIPYFMSINQKEYVAYYINYFTINNERKYDTYEEALEEGLYQTLLLI